VAGMFRLLMVKKLIAIQQGHFGRFFACGKEWFRRLVAAVDRVAARPDAGRWCNPARRRKLVCRKVRIFDY